MPDDLDQISTGKSFAQLINEERAKGEKTRKYNWLINGGVVSFIGALVATVSFSLAMWDILNRPEQKKEFEVAVTNGLRAAVINDLNDIINIYAAENNLGPDYGSKLTKQLRLFLSNLYKDYDGKKINKETMQEWKGKISTLIAENEKEVPFADLAPAERNIINDLFVLISKKEMEGVRRKAKELAVVLQAKQESLATIETINEWTLPLSIAGVFFTVLFGIQSVILGRRLKKEQDSKNELVYKFGEELETKKNQNKG